MTIGSETFNLCPMISSLEVSARGAAWDLLASLWAPYWWIITPAIIIWLLYELATRNGSSHYNSQNGFSPAFNVFVGSACYFITTLLINGAFVKLFGDAIYCKPISYIVHLISFALVGIALLTSGFWKYLNWLPGFEKSSQRRNF